MSVVQILYKGVNIVNDVVIADAFFESLADGKPGQSGLRVKDVAHLYAPDYFHVGGTLELWIDGVREWDGWVMTVGRAYAFPVDRTEVPTATPRFWVLQGVDRNFLFERRILMKLSDPTAGMPRYASGTSDLQVITEILQDYVDLTGDGLDIVSGIQEIAPPG